MKDYELLDAVGGIDPEYIEEADKEAPKSKAVWRKALLPAAACLGIVIGAAVLLSKVPFSSLKPNAGNDADAGAGVGSADPGGMFVDGVDPVMASVAVLPDFEELKGKPSAFMVLEAKYNPDTEKGIEPEAVYYDWDAEAVSRLKHLIEETKAEIVLSSDWRHSKN